MGCGGRGRNTGENSEDAGDEGWRGRVAGKATGAAAGVPGVDSTRCRSKLSRPTAPDSYDRSSTCGSDSRAGRDCHSWGLSRAGRDSHSRRFLSCGSPALPASHSPAVAVPPCPRVRYACVASVVRAWRSRIQPRRGTRRLGVVGEEGRTQGSGRGTAARLQKGNVLVPCLPLSRNAHSLLVGLASMVSKSR